MENTMIKSLSMSAALLSIVLLMSAGSISAGTGGTSVPIPGSAAQIKTVASAVHSSQILTLWASSIYSGDGEGKDYDDKHGDRDHDRDHDGDHDRDHDGDHDRGRGRDRDGHNPTPEPSTILSFGAAVL